MSKYEADFSKAPEGATHYNSRPTAIESHRWFSIDGRFVSRWVDGQWVLWNQYFDVDHIPAFITPIPFDHFVAESQSVTTEQVGRIQSITKCVEIDLDAPIEWNGEGLPPVGSKVWFSDCGPYEAIWPDGLNAKGCEVEIIAHHAASGFVDVAVFRFRSEASASEFYYVGQAIAKCFRPVLTDEQKAAKEREESVSQILSIIHICDTYREVAEELYNAGYRKQEQE